MFRTYDRRENATLSRAAQRLLERCLLPRAEAEPKVKDGEGEEGAEGVEKGIIGRVS